MLLEDAIEKHKTAVGLLNSFKSPDKEREREDDIFVRPYVVRGHWRFNAWAYKKRKKTGLAAVILALCLFSAVGARAGTESCWATGGLGAGATCKVTGATKCTVIAAFMRFNAGCAVCVTSAVRCDLASTNNGGVTIGDLRVDLYTSGTNYTDSQQIGPGVSGQAVAVGCDNTAADAVEVSLIANCQ